MNAIFGCLVAMGGAVLLVQDLVTRDVRLLWLPVLLLVVGPFMMLRHQRDDEDERPDDGRCRTCRGAGSVHSAEWNDWRRAGPILNVREPCPDCRPVDATSGSAVRVPRRADQ